MLETPVIQNTIFGRHSRFHWDFHNQFENQIYWEKIATRYENWLSIQASPPQQSVQIPPIIHQIWLGPNPRPYFFNRFANSWKKNNPKFEYHLWTDENIDKLTLRNQELFDSLENFGAKSDVLRYELLQQYGGVYVDVDVECFAAIPEALLRESFVGGLQFNGSPEIGNAFLMAAPDSIIIDQIISQCVYPKKDDAFEIFKATGPYLVSKILYEYLESPQTFLVLPSNYVYPMPSFLASTSENPYSFLTNETIAMHYWNLSWLPIPKKSLLTVTKSLIKRLIPPYRMP